VSASNRGADMVWVVPCRVRSALLTSLDGLPSDELFAIPATRTASVYVESSGLEKTETLPPCERAWTTTSIPPICYRLPRPRHALRRVFLAKGLPKRDHGANNHQSRQPRRSV